MCFQLLPPSTEYSIWYLKVGSGGELDATKRAQCRLMAAFLVPFGAGLALGGLTGTRVLASSTRPVTVIVVGGGIVGASVAYHLARRGAQVTLLEKSLIKRRAGYDDYVARTAQAYRRAIDDAGHPALLMPAAMTASASSAGATPPCTARTEAPGRATCARSASGSSIGR